MEHEQMLAATAVDLAIVGGTVVPCDGGAPTPLTVTVTNGKIVGLVAPGTPIDAGRTIDASGSAVLPGFVDCHTHIASNLLLRGLLEDVELFGWLSTMWRLKQNFDHETLYWASMCGLVEMARSGITCFNEHFDGYAVTPEVRALDEIGLRGNARVRLRRRWRVRLGRRLVVGCVGRFRCSNGGGGRHRR